MGEPVRSPRAPIQHSEGQHYTQSDRPDLEVLPGEGSTPPRAEEGDRIVLEDLDDEAGTVTSPEEAPTEKTEATLQREEETKDRAKADAQAKAEAELMDPTPLETKESGGAAEAEITPPPEEIKQPTYDLATASEVAAKPSTVDRIGAWLSGVAKKREANRAAREEAAFQKLDARLAAEVEADRNAEQVRQQAAEVANQKYAAERIQPDREWQDMLVEFNILPRDPDAEQREPWDERPEMPDTNWEKEPDPLDPETRKAVEATKGVLRRGWEAMRKRIKSAFEEPDIEANVDNDEPAPTRLNERRVWGASITLGVIGAFAFNALLSYQMESFKKNVEDYLNTAPNLAVMQGSK